MFIYTLVYLQTLQATCSSLLALRCTTEGRPVHQLKCFSQVNLRNTSALIWILTNKQQTNPCFHLDPTLSILKSSSSCFHPDPMPRLTTCSHPFIIWNQCKRKRPSVAESPRQQTSVALSGRKSINHSDTSQLWASVSSCGRWQVALFLQALHHPVMQHEHPFIHPLSAPLICQGCVEARASPSWPWARGAVHSGQVTLSFTPMGNFSLICMSLGGNWKPANFIIPRSSSSWSLQHPTLVVHIQSLSPIPRVLQGQLSPGLQSAATFCILLLSEPQFHHSEVFKPRFPFGSYSNHVQVISDGTRSR